MKKKLMSLFLATILIVPSTTFALVEKTEVIEPPCKVIYKPSLRMPTCPKFGSHRFHHKVYAGYDDTYEHHWHSKLGPIGECVIERRYHLFERRCLCGYSSGQGRELVSEKHVPVRRLD